MWRPAWWRAHAAPLSPHLGPRPLPRPAPASWCDMGPAPAGGAAYAGGTGGIGMCLRVPRRDVAGQGSIFDCMRGGPTASMVHRRGRHNSTAAYQTPPDQSHEDCRRGCNSALPFPPAMLVRFASS